MKKIFSSLKYANFRLFWFGQLVSLTGTWVQMVAQGWLVLELTNSAFLLAMINVISAAPIMLFSLVGGVVADRVNKKKILIVTQSLSVVLAFCLGALVSLKLAAFWNIAVIAGLLGLVNAFDVPTRQAFVVETIDKSSLNNAIALNSLLFNSARIIGPVIAGFLAGWLGIASCFYINSISFLAVIVALVFMTGDFSPKDLSKRPMVEGVIEGARYILSHRNMRALVAVTAVSSIFGMANVVLMPIFARDILGVGIKGLGFLMSSVGIGAIFGGLILARFGHEGNRKIFVKSGTIILALSLILFAMSTSYVFSLCLLLAAGWGIITQAVSVNTLLQMETPDNLRGRAMSFYTLVFLGMTPFGSFIAGLLAHWFGAPIALLFSGSACLLLTPLFFKDI
ncbi:MAG: MFS transporter [Candidatus Omnitrophica bacterium CG_4_8_14_3_um_filter_43_15]|nr:MAG: MFS transporter [Candidatus Omnitrophica bacterium CG_4_8_14_3_um_filter_43_15]PJC46415.1 MAG: MFS transporter [Candidatus Omnitrophica bacterium CG_4_9_14_0_2_um_filter_43_12]